MDPRIKKTLLIAFSAGAGVAVVIAALAGRAYCYLSGPKGEGSMDFEFGDTTKSKAFLEGHSLFIRFLEHTVALANACFGRRCQPKNRAEDVCFDLGQTCRDDYLQTIFLAINGYGIGASKLLRSLYERAVTLTYLTQHPEKAERFVRYAAVQEYKAIKSALKLVPEVEVDEMMQTQGLTVAKISQNFEDVKSEFQTTICDKCSKKTTAWSWDLDLASMAEKVGEPLSRLYLAACVISNLSIHATLASTNPTRPNEDQMVEKNRMEGRLALRTASVVIISVLACQNSLFRLGLDDDIEKLYSESNSVWPAPSV